MTVEVVTLSGVSKSFVKGQTVITPLHGIDFTIRNNDYTAIMGASGSGKTTLLSLVGCMATPTQGKICFEGKDISAAEDHELSRIRAKRIGFIFQNFFLIQHLDALQNVELPFLYLSIPPEEARERAVQSLHRVGLGHRLQHKPTELSGGEMQRVAIARAVTVQPGLILADEPTGNLDSETGRSILRLFAELHEEGTAILMVTHDPHVARQAGKTCFIKDGSFAESL